MAPKVTDADYRRLLEFRTGLRRFLRWSSERAADVGLTPPQHQLLLAVRGHPGPAGPSMGEIAGYLVQRPHTVTELSDRCEALGLVRRIRDERDHRVVRLELTALGLRKLERLAELTLEELERLGPRIRPLWDGLERAEGPRRRRRRPGAA